MNKHIILSTAALCLLSMTTTGHARNLDKGTIEIGGGLGLSTTSLEMKPEGSSKIETDSTALSANVLYYVAQNIGVGITWDYSSNEMKSSGYKFETTSNTFGPMAAYNISLNEKTSLKLGGALVMSSTEDKETGFATTTVDGYGWNLGGQLSYFLNDYVSLDGSLDYVSLSLEEDSTKTEIDTTGFAAGVGLTVYLK